MGCKCRLPAEQYPESADWGPLFWRILHGLAEKSGQQTTVVQQDEEIRIWIQLLQQLALTLPCDVCRAHYTEKISAAPPLALAKMVYSETGLYLRRWLWSVHNEVNEGNHRDVFPFEKLADTYKSVNITETWRALEPIMKRAITLNGITLVPWRKWLGFVRMLQGIYGI